MIGELVCPDCGGVVGATETTEAGPPCRCFVSDNVSKSETVADVPPPVEAPPVPAAKVCRICGKDVSGEKRVKDHAGYYCVPCAKEEEKKEHQGRVRCRVCGHLVKEENLTLYEGTKMCPKCQRERVELQKQQIKRIGFKAARTRAELQQIYMMLAALGVLLVIMAYGGWKLLHSH
jgi:DNA-directed RNA polymerase subunit RPC12/RpoP